MQIGDLIDNKLMSLVLQGYNPFQPDVGIFSGGYQGIMYPNPTTIAYPNFDSYAHVSPEITPYTPSSSYEGLGVGNPGIDYKNAGHLLGLFDTFARMSYGIGCWLSVFNGNSSPGGPVIDFNLPLVNSEFLNDPISFEDIYPAYTEVPSDWINGFEVGETGRITPDPRKKSAFVNGGGHIPSTSPIDAEALNILFANRSVFSYLGMPQFFRAIIESLFNAAAPLSQLVELPFTLEKDKYFNLFSHRNVFVDKDDEHEIRISNGTAYAQCVVNSPAVALKTLNGFSNYHDGQDGQNEYRSLTELNAVINLIPMQMVGATYWNDTKGFLFITPPGEFITNDQSSREFSVMSYMIADMVINISDVPEDPNNPTPGVVTIAGTAIIHNLISDPTDYYFSETRRIPSPVGSPLPGDIVTTIFGAREDYNKQIDIRFSAKNSFSWDKAWLDGGIVDETDNWNDTQLAATDIDGGDSTIGFEVLPTDDLIIEFSKQVVLDKGCTSIRLRAFLQNEHNIGHESFTDPSLWVPVEFCHEHGFIIFQPGFHCHYPAGVHFSEPAGDIDDVPNKLTTPNMELSVTVTGTNMDAIEMNVSI